MNIEVNVTDIDLKAQVSDRFYDDDEGGHYQTLADMVAAALTRRVVESGEYPGFRTEVTRIRDDEIRKAVAPLITEALTRPLPQTNGFGEPTGPATTLSEIIVAEARKQLTAKAGDSYSRDNRSVVQKLVADEVGKAFGSLIADEVKKARELVGDQIGDQVAAAVKAGLAKG